MARPRESRIDRAVLSACVDLLAEVGRSGLTRQRVAQRAGVSLPAVTRRFASVEGMLVLVAQSPPSVAAGSSGADSLRSYLIWSLTRTARGIAAPGVRRSAAELLAAAAGDPTIDAAVIASLDEVRAEGRTWIAGAIDKGQIDDATDPEDLLDLVTGVAYYRLLWRGLALAESDVAPLVDLVLAGAAAGR